MTLPQTKFSTQTKTQIQVPRGKGLLRGSVQRGASFDELAKAEAAQGTNLYAPRTVKARENAKRQVVEFHQRLYGPDPRFAALPIFHDTVSPSGQLVSAARNARLFFTERENNII